MALTNAHASMVLGPRANSVRMIFGIPAGKTGEDPGILCLEGIDAGATAYNRLYLWADSGNQLRYHTAIPTNENSDGSVLATTAESGVNKNLSNLAATSVNTSIISDTDSTDDLGSAASYWKGTYTDVLYLYSDAYITGASGKMIVTGAVEFGAAGTGVDVTFQADDYEVVFDCSEDILIFTDNAKLGFGDGSDFVVASDGTTLEINAAAANAIINIGASTATDLVLQGTGAGVDAHWDSSANTLGFLDTAKLGFGNTATAPDFWLTWDATDAELDFVSDDRVFNIGNTHPSDVRIHGDAADLLWDGSADVLFLQDNALLKFGTDGDMSIAGNNTTIEIDFIADNYVVNFGTSFQADLVLHGNDAGQDILFDASADALRILDTSKFQFGTGASTNGDISMAYNGGTNILAVTQVASGTGAITYGADGKGIDTTWYTETASSYIKLDQATDRILFYAAGLSVHNATVTYDVTLSTNSLLIDESADNVGGKIIFGASGTNGLDVTFQSATAGDLVVFDAGAKTWTYTDVGLVLGANSANQGQLTIWDGGGGNTPAWILMHSPNGTAHYLFFADDGDLRTHTSAPTATADGTVVGTQS